MNWKIAYASEKELGGRKFQTVAEVSAAGFDMIPASVPGNFELDLMREGKLDDLYFSTNTLKAQELEATHVWYFTKVSIENERQYLHFEGIDTFADIYVNGALVKSTDNMFLPYDVSADWNIGENEVLVHIKPMMLEARKFISPASCNAQKYSYPTLYVRKAAHMCGWDIMPRIVSAGIWKDVITCQKKEDEINEVYFVTSDVDLDKNSAMVRCYINADLSGSFAKDYQVKIEASCGDSSVTKVETLWHNTHAFYMEFQDCKFWWPKNVGEPNLYDTTVTLMKGDEVCDTYHLKLGIRTAELIHTATTDCDGNGEFCFKINGKKIFVLGTNWVPLDALHSQDLKRLPQALELLDDIGCNMVRCWGGNVYESDEFYEYCDAHGIMVWQDFGMGCGVYPLEKDFMDRLEKEATYQIKRLRNHPALVLWAGDNENDESWSRSVRIKRNPNQNTITRELLPKLVTMHDYARAYLPSSPWISEEVYQGKGLMPEAHLWGPRDYFKGDYYKNTFCHFASETGYHGFPSTDSLKKFLKEPEKIFKEDGNATDEYLVHAASMETAPNGQYAYRIKLAYRQVETLFGEAKAELDDFVRQSQISQAEAKKYFIEKFRIGKWKRTGIIWWNLLDGWPQVSDAIVDYYFTKKLAYHYIKRSQNPVCLMFDEPVENILTLVGVNDLSQDCNISYTVKKILPNKETKTVLMGDAYIKADSSIDVSSLRIENDEKYFYFIEWNLNGKNYKNHYFTNIIDIDYEYYLYALKVCEMDEFEGV